MSEQTKLYVSVESGAGHLIISGPLALLRELIGSFGATECSSDSAPAEDGSAASDDVQPVGAAR